MNTKASFSQQARSEHGVALILTLAILAMVTLLMIAFVVSMRVEQTASKNFNDLIRARQLAQGAVDDAVAVIRHATPILTTNRVWVAIPGAVIQKTSSGFTTKELYTPDSGDGTVNLNTGGFITGVNSFYDDTSVIAPGWLNVTNASGELVGRYAYWVDNEMAKINLNIAKWRDPAATNESNRTDIDLRALEPPFYNNLAAVTALVTERTAIPFTTLEEMRRMYSPALGYNGFRSNLFFTTVATVDTNTDVFGRERIDINSISEADITNPSSEIRRRLDDPTWATVLYNGIVTDTTRNTLEKKYGVFGIQQILANMIDYRRPASQISAGADDRDSEGIPRLYCGLKKFPLLGEIMIQAASTNIVTSAVDTTTNYTVRLSVYCDARLVNPFPEPLGSNGVVKFVADSITVEATPAEVQAQLSFLASDLPELSRQITANLPARSQRNLNYAWEPNPTDTNRICSSRPDSCMYRKTATYTDSTGVAPQITRVVVRMKKVRLLRGTDDNTIQDWATETDFTQVYPGGMEFSATSADGGRIVPDMQTGDGSIAQGGGNSPRFSTSGTTDPRGARLGIAKNDPRVRTFPDQGPTSAAKNRPPPKAWFKPTQDPACFGACGSRPTGTAPAAEVLGWVPTLTEPNFTQNYYGLLADNRDIIAPVTTPQQERQSTFWIKESNFESLGELSYIHTGYQWRNVRLRASVAYTGSDPAGPATSDPNRPDYLTVERDALQDWVLLDILKIGSDIVPGRLNLNSKFIGPAAPLPSRIIPYVALLNACTTNLAVGASSEAQLNIIASNIVNRVFATNSTAATSSPYTALPAYFTAGEYCEVFDMDYYNDPRGGLPFDNWPGKAEREQLIRRVSNLVTARSNLFAIWAIAQSIKDVDQNGRYDPPSAGGQDFIAGEVKVQAIVERYEEGGQVKFRTRYHRYIYE